MVLIEYDNSSSSMPKSGTNSQGNHYNTPGGSNSNQGDSYHYSNKNGSYYYKNDNGSTYYDNGKGSSTYTPPKESVNKQSKK
ncbi:hypothetical protein ACHAWO_009211 [Cyclotella atomus]|uniref:Uncharacterized protein n=1 Tax=Cyclotella atomus TaxID=382360 RepID=A0ABD3P5U2_9STRA